MAQGINTVAHTVRMAFQTIEAGDRILNEIEVAGLVVSPVLLPQPRLSYLRLAKPVCANYGRGLELDVGPRSSRPIERTLGKHQDAGEWSPVGRQAERTGEYAIGRFDF